MYVTIPSIRGGIIDACGRCRYAKQPWSRFVPPDNKLALAPDCFDLLDKLLRYNHLDRLTASEAMAHSFFSA